MSLEKSLQFLYPILNEISPLSLDTWNQAYNFFSSKKLQQHEHLFNIGDKVKDFYFLIKGIARYYYINDYGKEFNKSFAEKPGHLISSISSVSMKHEVSPFCVETLSDVTVVCISYKNFLTLGKTYQQWNNLTLRIFEKLIFKKERREADFLLLNPKERYEKFLAEYSIVAKKIQNYHIASYLGITEVSLSRIRKEMKLT